MDEQERTKERDTEEIPQPHVVDGTLPPASQVAPPAPLPHLVASSDPPNAEPIAAATQTPSARDFAALAKKVHERWQPLAAIIVGSVSICTAIVFAFASKASADDVKKDQSVIMDLGAKLTVINVTITHLENQERSNADKIDKGLKEVTEELKRETDFRARSETMAVATKESLNRIDATLVRLDAKIDERIRTSKDIKTGNSNSAN